MTDNPASEIAEIRATAKDVFSGSVDLSCGFSCDGVTVAGNRESIDAVKNWHHEAGTAPYLRDRIAEAYAANASLTAQLAKCREALKPFASAASQWSDWGDLLELLIVSTKDGEIERAVTIMVADLRRAEYEAQR